MSDREHKLTEADVGRWFVTNLGGLIQVESTAEMGIYSAVIGGDMFTETGEWSQYDYGHQRSIDWEASERVGQIMLDALIEMHPQLAPMRDLLVESGAIVEDIA